MQKTVSNKMKHSERYKPGLAAVLIVQIFLLMFLTWQFGGQRLDGDDSAEMVLANHLSREGGILSKNWYYSTELRVLSTQIVMSSLFRLSDNWRLVRTLGTGILAGLLVLSYLFMCSRVPEGDRLRKWAPVVLMPFSYVYLDMVLYGLYYIPHISIIFMSLGLLLSDGKRRGRIDAVLLLLLAFVAGMGGARIPAVGYAPMFAASLCLYFTDKTFNKKTLMRSFGACAAAGAGLLVNKYLLSGPYTFMSRDFVRLTAPDIQKAILVLLCTAQVCGGDRPAFSVYGAGAVLGLVLFLGVVCMFGLVVKKRREVSAPLRTVILTFVVSWLVTAFTGVCTNNGWVNRYAMIPCMGMIPVLAEGTSLNGEKIKKRLTAVFAGMLMLCSVNQAYRFATDDKLENVRPAYNYILESGITFGYGTWEVADVLTEVSNGRIHMCKVQNFENMHRWNWLMEKEYMKYAEEGPVFVLLDRKRFDYTEHNIGHFIGEWTKEDLKWMEEAIVGFEDEYYVVWVFSSEKEFEELTGSRPYE